MSTKSDRMKYLFGLAFGILLVGCLVGCQGKPTEPVQSNQSSGGSVVDHPVTSTEAIAEDPQGINPEADPSQVQLNQLYSSPVYGYQFRFPKTWQVAEIDQGVEVRKGSARLMIQTWWTGDHTAQVRWPGMPAGDRLYRDKLSFLGEVVAVHELVYEDQTKQVFYNEGKAIPAGDLQVLAYLETQEADYDLIDLPEQTIGEAKMILESFQRIDHAAPPSGLNRDLCSLDDRTPPGDWRIYHNQDYGFSLSYPAGMQVFEADEHLLEIHQGELILRLEFRRVGQEYPLPGFATQGEIELTRFVNYFGDENPNPIVVEKVGGQVNRVSVGNQIGKDTPVQFQASITGVSGGGVDLDQANAMLEILDYLCLIS